MAGDNSILRVNRRDYAEQLAEGRRHDRSDIHRDPRRPAPGAGWDRGDLAAPRGGRGGLSGRVQARRRNGAADRRCRRARADGPPRGSLKQRLNQALRDQVRQSHEVARQSAAGFLVVGEMPGGSSALGGHRLGVKAAALRQAPRYEGCPIRASFRLQETGLLSSWLATVAFSSPPTAAWQVSTSIGTSSARAASPI